MERMRKKLAALPPWTFSFLTVILILWLTLAPKPLGDEPPQLFPGADKVVHAIMFGFLTVVLLTDFQRRRLWRSLRWKVVIFFILISSAFGSLIEVCQLKMGMGRGFEWEDIIADSAGAIICGVIWGFLQSKWVRRA